MKIPKGLDKDTFREYFEDNYKNLILIDDYTNGSTKMKISCKIDDNTWEVFARNVYEDENMVCKECNRRKSNLLIKDKFRRIYPTLRISTPDIFSNPKTIIRCDECGHRFEVYRKHLIGDNTRNFSEVIDETKIVFFRNKKKELECPKCSIKPIKQEFEKIVEQRNCTIVGEYLNNTTPVTIECNVCKTQFGVVPNYYIDKVISRCKFCKRKPGGKVKWKKDV